MKIKILLSIFVLGGLLLVGCDSTVYTDTKEVQAKRIDNAHEEEIAEEVMKQEPKIIDPLEVSKEAVHEVADDSPEDSPEVALAKCLTANGVKLYTASWCGHCKNQKEAFGEGLEYLNNTECAEGDNWAQACKDAGVKAVPTWIFADGTVQTGNTPLAKLAEENGCTYDVTN